MKKPIKKIKRNLKNYFKNIRFLLRNISRLKKIQKKRELKELRKLIRKYDQSLSTKDNKDNIEKKIYQLLERHLKIICGKTTRTAWLLIEGIVITEKESEAIKSILEKRDYKFQKAA